ncbi:MAG: tetratricopeptide repeat protein, partial [Acidobacteria bacterium]|nr:tetratricopeptide repeat protein [Acidobacteriota bacterium]
MTLADERLKQLDSPGLDADERILVRCGVAAGFINAGQYEEAREALGELWRGLGERPEVETLGPATAAEALLQCGVLSGWLGSARNTPGTQEKAKDLLSEALREFQSQGARLKASEAQYELGMCYWRLGAHDEARVTLDEALKGLAESDAELRAKILIRHTLVEVWTGRCHDAWRILKEAQPFFESCGDAIKGRWHGQLGIILLKLATTEGRADYADRAIIEFTAAIYHYEQAKHERYCATNLNNLAFLLYKSGRYGEAHAQLDRAQSIFTKLKDPGNLAQVDETRARVLVAERKYPEANRIIANVVQTFDRSGESALLADALTVQGVVWARLGNFDLSLEVLRHAVKIGYDAGALANAGLAALTLIEEHGEGGRLSDAELYDLYQRADELLRGTQDVEDIARLRACAR